MSSANEQTHEYSPRAFEKLRETACRVRTSELRLLTCGIKSSHLNERERLGGDIDAAYERGGAVRMWATLYGCSDLRAVIDVAHKLNHLSSSDREWLLKESGEHLSADDAYEDAILRDGLVLNSATREIYWNGEPIAIDWSHTAKWAFMWELAKHGKARSPIDAMTFGDNKETKLCFKNEVGIV